MLGSVGTKLCLYPNKIQTSLFYKFANTSRGLYNLLLAECIKAYEEEGIKVSFKNNYAYYKSLKTQEAFSWLKEIPEACCKQVCKDLYQAYQRVFKSGFGFPKFKKKGRAKLSFYQRTDNIRFVDRYVYITGIGWVKCQKGYCPEGNVCNPRVTFDGKHWYLSFSEQGLFADYYSEYNEGIGLDMGIKDFCVCSDGTRFFNYNSSLNLLKLDARIKKLQQVLSRKYELNKDGNKFIKTQNILKLEDKIRLLRRKASNIKLNYVHYYSSTLVKTKPKFIAMEDLDIKGMKEANNNLSKDIQKLMWYEFKRQLQYKGAFYGIDVISVNRYFPSSQLCSCCGSRKEMPLNVRLYTCDVCGLSIDRDLNAAVNIRNEALRLLSK